LDEKTKDLKRRIHIGAETKGKGKKEIFWHYSRSVKKTGEKKHLLVDSWG
jgi:hypothetical protein